MRPSFGRSVRVAPCHTDPPSRFRKRHYLFKSAMLPGFSMQNHVRSDVHEGCRDPRSDASHILYQGHSEMQLDKLKSIGRTGEIRVGTAGWSIPRAAAFRFDSAGTHLQRYARCLRCTEINSSFHRPHAVATYAKWRESTPEGFSVRGQNAPDHHTRTKAAGRAGLICHVSGPNRRAGRETRADTRAVAAVAVV